MTCLELYLFGPPRILLDGVPVELGRRKAVALLAYLALSGKPHSRASLAALLWAEHEPARAYAYLRRTLWELTRTLGPDWMTTTREQIHLPSHPDLWIDVAAFRDALEECGLTREGDLGANRPCLDQLVGAASLFQDNFLAGFTLPDAPAFDQWQLAEESELRLGLALCLRRLIEGYRLQADWATALGYARRWLEIEPYEEAAHRELMRLYVAAGQRTAALRQYEECRQMLAREFGLEPQPETTALFESIRSQSAGPFEPEQTSATPGEIGTGSGVVYSLPAQLTPFVGRRGELSEVSALLQDAGVRLVTITGPGGIGKTRLAIQAAVEAAPAFQDGAVFVGLAALTSSDALVAAISRLLNFSFPEQGGAPRRQLIDSLRRKHLLLVLDNFEQLIDEESVDFCLELAAAAPEVKLLITSRTSLNVRGEHLYPLSGMSLPEANQEWTNTQELAGYSAIQLFVQSAQRMHAGFELTPANLNAVVEICRLAQGMPLAIELAAAWLPMLTPEEIVVEIRRCLDFLETEMRDIPERQRSLRAVFNSTWEALNESGQQIFQRLSVFQGGFSREGAWAVAGATLRDLVILSNQSLVRREGDDRYAIHELLRQFAAEKLEADPELASEVRRLHGESYAAFLERLGNQLRGPEQKRAYILGDQEVENIRSAWVWAAEQGRVDLLDRGLSGFFDYMDFRMQGRELDRLLDLAIQVAEAGFPARGHRLLFVKLVVLRARSFSEFVSSRPVAWLRPAVEIVRELKAEAELGWWFAFLAAGFAWSVDPHEGMEMLRQAQDLLREAGDDWGVAFTLLNLGQLRWKLGETEQPRAMLLEAERLFREMGDYRHLGTVYTVLGILATRAADFAEARRLHQHALDMFDEIGDLGSRGDTLEQMGHNELNLGDYEQAAALFKLARQANEKLGRDSIAWGMLSWESIALARLGELKQAEELRREMLRFATAGEDPTGQTWGHWELGELLRLQGDFEAARSEYEASRRFFEYNTLFSLDPFYHRGLGEIALATGDLEAARQEFRKSLEFARRDYHFWAEAYALGGLARAESGLGQAGEALSLGRQAVLLAGGQGDRGLLLHNLEALAEVYTAVGRPADEVALGVELAAFVSQHQATWQESRDRAAHILSSTAARLPSEQLKEASGRARSRTLEEMAAFVVE